MQSLGHCFCARSRYEKVREYFREDAKSRGGKKKGSQASALRRRALLKAVPADM